MIRCLALAFACLAGQALAAPETYTLDPARSVVGFTYRLAETESRGQMPVKSATMLIDLRNISASRVEVTLDAKAARSGFVLATQAMRGPGVLDSTRFPEIIFRSTRITGTLGGATVEGDLTLRGVSRPVTLRAELYRQSGSDPGDLEHLTVLLTGQIDRHAFGADGFSELVGPMIGLRILARIEK